MFGRQVETIRKIAADLIQVGVRSGGILMVHSSLKSMGHVPGGPEIVIRALLEALGPEGTLLMPALTYETVTNENPVFNIAKTPTCVGALTEYFRKRVGTIRSMHPTHSVCGVGRLAQGILEKHINDTTPCGPNSPFFQILDYNGQILMLGCDLKPNTSMHGIEELVEPPYLFGPYITYQLIDGNGHSAEKEYHRHGFEGWEQRYDRVENILDTSGLKTGKVLNASVHLIEAKLLWKNALVALGENPLYFVNKI